MKMRGGGGEDRKFPLIAVSFVMCPAFVFSTLAAQSNSVFLTVRPIAYVHCTSQVRPLKTEAKRLGATTIGVLSYWICISPEVTLVITMDLCTECVARPCPLPGLAASSSSYSTKARVAYQASILIPPEISLDHHCYCL